MGWLTDTVMLAVPAVRSLVEGPLPLTSTRVIEWLSGPAAASGAHIGQESALRIGAVYACVRAIAEDVASLPLVLYRRQGDEKNRATEHPLYELLHDAPNPHMTAMQFRETLQGHMLLWGNAYANVERDDDGVIVALWPLRPDRMETPKLAQDGRLLYRYRLPTGEPRELTQDEVLHLRGLSSNGVMGYSPITLHRESLGLTMAALEYGSRFFGNDSRPGGVLQVKNRLSKEAADRLRTGWEEAHRGLTAAHRVAVLEEGVEWKQVGIPPEQAQFLETRTFQVQDIARIFRVPPHKIGELSRATFSNIDEQALEYVTDTLRSWLVRWEQQIRKDLLLPQERQTLFAEHLMDALVRGTIEKRYAAYATARQWGWMSANDIRAKENMNSIPGGDEYLVPMNMIPAGAPRPAPEPPATRRVILRDEQGRMREIVEAP